MIKFDNRRVSGHLQDRYKRYSTYVVPQCNELLVLELFLTTVLASASPILQGRDSEIDTLRGGSLVLDVFADNVEGRSTAGRSEVRGRP